MNFSRQGKFLKMHSKNIYFASHEKKQRKIPIYFILLKQHIKRRIWSIGECHQGTFLQNKGTFFILKKEQGRPLNHLCLVFVFVLFFVFLIFNNFENSYSRKQLWTAASSFPQKNWWYLTIRIFAGQNISEPLNYLSFLSDGSAINLITLTAKIKVYTFFYNHLNFPSQPLVTVFVS